MPPLAPVTTNRRPSWRGTSRQVRLIRPGSLEPLGRRLARDRRGDLPSTYATGSPRVTVRPTVQSRSWICWMVRGRISRAASPPSPSGNVTSKVTLSWTMCEAVPRRGPCGPRRGLGKSLERRPLADDVVEVGGTATDQRREQQLDRREVGVLPRPDQRPRHRGCSWPSSDAPRSGGDRCCGASRGPSSAAMASACQSPTIVAVPPAQSVTRPAIARSP